MDKEKAAFATRLRAALEAKGIEASAAVVEKRFNSRFEGAPVTAQAVSGWLNGKSIPKQDKLRVLAAMLGMAPHELQYGGKPRIADVGTDWSAALGQQERQMMDAYVSLPAAQRKLVRELVATLARAVENAG